MSTKSLFAASLIGGLVGASGNYLVYFIARAMGAGFTGQFNGPTVEDLPIVAIGISSVIPSLVAPLVLLGIRKVSARPLQVFVAASAVLALVSTIPPMMIADASLGTRVALALMHLVSAAAILGAIILRSERKPDGSPA